MNLREGDRVQIVSRDVTEDDKKTQRYYLHMAGLKGSVQNIYGETEIAVQIELETLSKITREVHKEATQRMRNKLNDALSEVQRKELTKEELEFDTHFMLLVHSQDLVKI